MSCILKAQLLRANKQTYLNDRHLMKAFQFFIEKKGGVRKKKAVKEEVKVEEVFLEYCFKNKKKVNKDTIKFV